MKPVSSEKGGVLAGVIIAILILGVVAVGGIFLAGIYFAENIHVRKTEGAHGGTVQVDTPIGSMRVRISCSKASMTASPPSRKLTGDSV